jgi:hypothetical protein
MFIQQYQVYSAHMAFNDVQVRCYYESMSNSVREDPYWAKGSRNMLK